MSRQLDAEVAGKVMGWHVESVCYPHTDDWFDNWIDADGVGRYSVERSADQWLPSEFITHAFEVIERMRKLGYEVDIYSHEDLWTVTFKPNFQAVYTYTHHAPSLQVAICKAALEALKSTSNTSS